jgi:hypothetical protein
MGLKTLIRDLNLTILFVIAFLGRLFQSRVPARKLSQQFDAGAPGVTGDRAFTLSDSLFPGYDT